jgi:hypothetical protein
MKNSAYGKTGSVHGAGAQKSGSRGDSGGRTTMPASAKAGAGNVKGGATRTPTNAVSGAKPQKSGSKGG